MIIGLVGRASSGKGTSSKAIHGHILKEKGEIQDYTFEGPQYDELIIHTNGNRIRFDPMSLSPKFMYLAENTIWKYVKEYSFATPLKLAVHELFGVPLNLLGSGNKDVKTNVTWGQLKFFLNISMRKKIKDNKLDGTYLTIRNILEEFGTNFCRKIDEDIFVKRLTEHLQRDRVPVQIVSDIRRNNEALKIKELGGVLVRLKRNWSQSAISESDIDLIVPDIDIDNSDMSVKEKNEVLLRLLKENGAL